MKINYRFILLCLFVIIGSRVQAAEVILYSSFESGNWDIWMIHPDKSNARILINSPLDEKAPALSPDGAYIAYHDNRGSVRIAGFDGASSDVLAQSPGLNSYPCWTSDGAGIVYCSRPSPTKEAAGIFYNKIQPVAAATPITLVEPVESNNFPALSPDGKRLVFSRFLSQEKPLQLPREPLIEELYILDITSGKISQITNLKKNSALPRWAPDGTKIVFSSNAAGSYDLWLVDIGEKISEPRRLTEDPGFEGFPAWSPDGEKIVFTSSRTGNMELWILDVSSGDWMQLTNSEKKRDSMEPCWGRLP